VLLAQTLGGGALNSSNRLSSIGKPAHILNKFSRLCFYLNNEFTIGASILVLGALQRYPRVVKMVSNLMNSFIVSVFHWILSNNSVNNNKSKIIGAANNESSQTLYNEIVCFPPKKISATYSSIAFLLSPADGTYLMMISWSIFFSSGLS